MSLQMHLLKLRFVCHTLKNEYLKMFAIDDFLVVDF